MGPPGIGGEQIKKANQLKVHVDATTTTYTFALDQTDNVTVAFTTPAIDLDSPSAGPATWPLTYVSFSATTDVEVYFDATAEAVVASVDAVIEASRVEQGGLTTLTVGAKNQDPMSSNDDSISWGYFSVTAEASSTTIADAEKARGAFASGAPLPPDSDDLPKSANDGWTVVAVSGDVSQDDPLLITLFLDQTYSMMYFGEALKPYWTGDFDSSISLIAHAHSVYEDVFASCREFDESLRSSLEAVGGSKYADLLVLSYRQVTGALETTMSPDGDKWVFMKEISSDGDVSTVDVIYPAAPMFLHLYPDTLLRMMPPLMDYALNMTDDRDYDYGLDWAPHHLGVWPVCDIKQDEQEQMPVEESSNMLILFAALAQFRDADDLSWAYPYLGLMKTWADYNVQNGLPDPGEQLCTDDFMGPSPHNANLAAKGIVSIGAYAQLLELVGDLESAGEYREIAEGLVQEWMGLAYEDGGDQSHSKLQYDLDDDSWSLKYNLLFDRVLGLGLFPQSVYDLELKWYEMKLNSFGVPLDSRADFTKCDWEFWVGAMDETPTGQYFHMFVDALFDFADKTGDRVPLTDWHGTVDPTQSGFQARPVLGGLYARMIMPQPARMTEPTTKQTS